MIPVYTDEDSMTTATHIISDTSKTLTEVALERLQQERKGETDVRRLRNMSTMFINANGIPYNPHTAESN